LANWTHGDWPNKTREPTNKPKIIEVAEFLAKAAGDDLFLVYPQKKICLYTPLRALSKSPDRGADRRRLHYNGWTAPRHRAIFPT
jgi:hypothetical protein